MNALLDILEPLASSPPAATLTDRYHGTMLGLAVGNMLGIPIEGHSKSLVMRRFPEGLREIAVEESRMPWDDDLAQAVIVAESILEHDRLHHDDLARRFQGWRRENGRGIGHLTRRVLEAMESGTPPEDAARVVWEDAGRNAAGNGAVMRCAPIALRWRRAPVNLVNQTQWNALVTHHDPRCGWSAVAVNMSISASLDGRQVDDRFLAELAAAMDDAGAPPAVAGAIRAVQGADLHTLSLDHDNTMGYTLKAMQAALWALLQPTDFETTLLEVVNAGGDADTNGAVAGAALGARHGAAAIPSRWLDAVRDADTLRTLAGKLLEQSERVGAH
jgi:ADP-ribosyl-[dinitrogen reductase] hydrolase